MRPPMSDFPDHIYHGQIVYRPLLDTGIVALPKGALGALAVFATKEQAAADNEAHGGSATSVDGMAAATTDKRQGEKEHGKEE